MWAVLVAVVGEHFPAIVVRLVGAVLVVAVRVVRVAHSSDILLRH